MGLFKPAWKSTNREKALEALKPDVFGNEKMSLRKLAKIAKKAPLEEVRKQASFDLLKRYSLISVCTPGCTGVVHPGVPVAYTRVYKRF